MRIDYLLVAFVILVPCFLFLAYILRVWKKSEIFSMTLFYWMETGKTAGKVKKSEHPASFTTTLILYSIVFLIMLVLGLFVLWVAIVAD